MRGAIDTEVFNNAVEEYERINRTNVKETKQYQDLLKEKNLLYKRIVELTKNEEGKEMKKKVIDLSNTWCEATKEIWDKFYRLGFPDIIVDFQYCTSDDYYHIENNTLYQGKIRKYKQIHLVNGEFEYVTDTNVGENKNNDINVLTKLAKSAPIKLNDKHTEKECQFKKYGFEVPEFECEILKEVKGNKINGTKRFLGHIINDEGISYPCIFEEWGECNFCTSVHSEDFKLTPLKKPWYKDESNFPCAIIDSYDNIRVIFFGESFNKESWRPATKEEVLQLVIN